MTTLTSHEVRHDPSAEESLRQAADAAASLAKQVSEAANAGRRGRSTKEILTTIQDLQGRADALRGQLAEAASRLDVRTAFDELARRFSAETWPARANAYRMAIAQEPTSGARQWLDAWVEAVVSGQFDEAIRLTKEPFDLPPAARWWPDRLIIALDALSRRDPDRWAPLSVYLTGGAELGEQGSISASRVPALLLLEARLVASVRTDRASLDRADGLVARAANVLQADDCDVVSARSAIARHRPNTPEVATAAEPGVENDWVAALAGPGNRCAGRAVEYLHWAVKSGLAGEALLTEARLAIAPLLPVGLENQIEVLVEAAPDEVWIALAERLRIEGLPGAEGVLERVGADTNPMAAWARDRLRVDLARDDNAGAPKLADALTLAGGSAIAADHTVEGIANLEEALTLVPDHVDAMLTLADGLVVSVSTKPIDQSLAALERARRLCLDAHAVSYPDENTSWSLLVLARIEKRLAERAGPGREAAGWRGVLAAARAVALGPDFWASWADLANLLITAGRYRAADVAARLAREISLDPEITDERRLRALVNIGRYDEGLELLDAIEAAPEGTEIDPAWRSAMRALFVVERDPTAALQHVESALQAGPDGALWYHELRGDLLAITGKLDDAGAEWRWVWQHAELAEYDGLLASARSALKQQLYSTALALAQQLAAYRGGPQDTGDGALIRGLATLASGGDGWDDVRAAVRSTPTEGLLDDVQLLCRVMAALSPAVDVAETDAAVADARRALRDIYDGLTPGLQAARELDPDGLEAAAEAIAVDRRPRPDAPIDVAGDPDGTTNLRDGRDDLLDDVAITAARIASALCLIGDGDHRGAAEIADLGRAHPEYPELTALAEWAGALADSVSSVLAEQPSSDDEAEPADDSDVETILLGLGSGWFEDEEAFPGLFQRAFQDAGAIAGRAALPVPNVMPGRDASLPTDGFRIWLPNGESVEGEVRQDRWYTPLEWRSALDGHVDSLLTEERSVPGFTAFPAPSVPDATLTLIAWKPFDIVARRAFGAYADSLTIPPSAAPAPAPSLFDRILAWLRRLLGIGPSES